MTAQQQWDQCLETTRASLTQRGNEPDEGFNMRVTGETVRRYPGQHRALLNEANAGRPKALSGIAAMGAD